MAKVKAKAVAIAVRMDEAAHNKETQATLVAYAFTISCIAALFLL
ncbi:hypothetical protein [Rhizobium sp. L1K21]|nr:hypothetical protein [Rhizobium sp. L1K21]